MASPSYRNRPCYYLAGGKKMRRVFDSISRGLLLIAIGVVFFLINYGILSWSFWWNVVDLWPLILILTGIGLLFSRRIPMSAVLLVFLLSMVGYSLVVGDRPVPGHWQLNPLFSSSNGTGTLDVPLPSDVKKAQVNLNLGGAQVQIKALDPENSEPQLMTGNYKWEGQGFATGSQGSGFIIKQAGDTLTATLSPAFGESTDKRNLRDLKLNLSTKVHYDLDITAGAINGNIDLSRLAVDNLKIGTGASKFDLQFGDTGIVTKGKIDSGASKLTLVVPGNVGLTIRLTGVATSTNFMGSGLFSEAKTWVSPNYAEAKTKIDLDISAAAGSIQLDRSKINIQ